MQHSVARCQCGVCVQQAGEQQEPVQLLTLLRAGETQFQWPWCCVPYALGTAFLAKIGRSSHFSMQIAKRLVLTKCSSSLK